jgi:hypothetical protein
VFWAVIAVIAVVPNTPRRMNTRRSAWMPAPPPESDPAIVIAIRVMQQKGERGEEKGGKNFLYLRCSEV